MSAIREAQVLSPPEAQCLGAVVCEDEVARARAGSICEHMARRFRGDIEFQFRWWLFDDLRRSVLAEEAAQAAVRAAMVFFATRHNSELPEHVKSWIESWVNARADQSGALVWLATDQDPGGSQAAPPHPGLLHAAHRAGMDFLSDVPDYLTLALPESPQWFNDRANVLGPVMDSILRQTGSPPPPMMP